VSALFSDMLGNHVVGAAVQANGGIKDIGGQVFYQNRTRRWNWGGVVGHIPYLSFFTVIRDTTVQGNNALLVEQIRERVFVDSGRLFAYYPFSTTNRFEVGAGFSYIHYDREIQREINVGGVILEQDRFDVASPGSLSLLQGTLAYVHDSSYFGFTSPIRGTRYRMEVGPTTGTLQYTTLLFDYRKYMFINPVTFAVRGFHVGRYGRDAEDPLLAPFFLGYATYMRGYTTGSFLLTECSGGSSNCPEFDRLFGSRMALFNAELRIPLIGFEEFGLINFPYLPTELVGFFDSGVAWSQSESFEFGFRTEGADRMPVYSTGASARFNLLGALIMEVYWAYPFQRPFKGAHWGVQLAPGW
jgi:hypothetical protein